MKVFIGTSSFGLADQAPLQRLEEAGLEPVLNPYGRKIADDELPSLLDEDTVGIVAGLETLNRRVLSSSKVRVVSRVGAGTTNVDLDAARDLGILVYSTPDAPTQAVAELTIGAMLSLLRAVPAMDRDMHAGGWTKHLGRQLSKQVIAVIGYGRIGRRVSELARGFGATVIPMSHDDFQEALSQADIVTVHVSGSKCVLGANEFAQMKDGVYVLNAARGVCVDEGALAQALDSGKVAGAWIDVFEQEPYRGPLARYDNVILTPHVGSNTVECRVEMEAEAVDNLLDGLRQQGII